MAKLIAHAASEPAVLTPDGAERRVLSYSDHLMLVQFTFGPDVTSLHHSHPHEQIGYVVSGEIDVIMEGAKTVRLQAGGSYYAPPNVKHHIHTTVATVLVDCFTPAREDFLKSKI